MTVRIEKWPKNLLANAQHEVQNERSFLELRLAAVSLDICKRTTVLSYRDDQNRATNAEWNANQADLRQCLYVSNCPFIPGLCPTQSIP